MVKSKAGRPKGKVSNKPDKVIFSIQASKVDYEELKETAGDEQRSVSQMASILIHKGLFPDE